jgi:hypothetical protein
MTGIWPVHLTPIQLIIQYRPNGRRRLGRPLKRILHKAATGLVRPNSWRMMVINIWWRVQTMKSPDSSVSLVPRQRDGHPRNLGSIPRIGKKFISFPKRPDRSSDPPSFTFNGHGDTFLRDKEFGAWSSTSIPHLTPRLRMSGLNLTFKGPTSTFTNHENFHYGIFLHPPSFVAAPCHLLFCPIAVSSCCTQVLSVRLHPSERQETTEQVNDSCVWLSGTTFVYEGSQRSSNRIDFNLFKTV